MRLRLAWPLVLRVSAIAAVPHRRLARPPACNPGCWRHGRVPVWCCQIRGMRSEAHASGRRERECDSAARPSLATSPAGSGAAVKLWGSTPGQALLMGAVAFLLGAVAVTVFETRRRCAFSSPSHLCHPPSLQSAAPTPFSACFVDMLADYLMLVHSLQPTAWCTPNQTTTTTGTNEPPMTH